MLHGVVGVVRHYENRNRSSKETENLRALRDDDKWGDEGLSSGSGVSGHRGMMEVQGRNGGLVT